jgi:hypothetical protein
MAQEYSHLSNLSRIMDGVPRIRRKLSDDCSPFVEPFVEDYGFNPNFLENQATVSSFCFGVSIRECRQRGRQEKSEKGP